MKKLVEIINTAINIADRKITQAGEWPRELRHQWLNSTAGYKRIINKNLQ